MILDDLEVALPSDETWVTRLRRGHFVWDAKGNVYYKVEWAYEDPQPGCRSGRIGICPCWRDGHRWGYGNIETWFTFPNGRGFDGSTLLLPVEALPINSPNGVHLWATHVSAH